MSLSFPIQIGDTKKMYRFVGTAVNLGGDSERQTPVLFAIKDTVALRISVHFGTREFVFEHVFHYSTVARRCDSRHFAFSFVDLVHFAYSNFQTG